LRAPCLIGVRTAVLKAEATSDEAPHLLPGMHAPPQLLVDALGLERRRHTGSVIDVSGS
jgi:hypothetical protein